MILAGDDDYWDGLLAWITRHAGAARQGARRTRSAILQRARTPEEVLQILKQQARTAPRGPHGRGRAGKEIP